MLLASEVGDDGPKILAALDYVVGVHPQDKIPGRVLERFVSRGAKVRERNLVRVRARKIVAELSARFFVVAEEAFRVVVLVELVDLGAELGGDLARIIG